jgi:hypothetical protein
MKSFLKYAEKLDGLLDEIEWGQRASDRGEEIQASLSGQAAEVLHETGNGNSIWRAGAYFTSPFLADLAIEPITQNPSVLRRPVCDPTCGAGDLLLRWADDLPVGRDLQRTLEKWEALFRGCDVYPEFVKVAKRRLVLKAIARGARLQVGRAPSVDKLFKHLKEGDARDLERDETLLTLVMNPPFSSVHAADDCAWSSGKVSLAAVLFESWIKRAAPQTRVVAILPDVLRTGSRYERWRASISEYVRIARIQPYGRFDEHADIDVFIVEGTVGDGTPVKWWQPDCGPGYGAVGDLFEVSVGAVVPHRDLHKGPWLPFATAKSVAAWKTISRIESRRRFEGTTVVPPFVAVRRTSSPRDSERAVASIVLGTAPVAVENHLLVAKPKRGGLERCKFLLKSLRHSKTKGWLDERIRCRHLTVGVLREIPLWEALDE